MSYRMKARAIANGVTYAKGSKQIVARFDDETFEQIRSRAIANGTSVNEQIRLLVEWGLETAKEQAA